MEGYLSWLAAGGTVTAAVMTAANIGARVTGWGFVVFSVSSLAWIAAGLQSGTSSLVTTNACLLIINMVGVWRWLGRQAAYERGSSVAASRSRESRHLPSLFSGSGLVGTAVVDQAGNRIGSIVDMMLAHDDKSCSYMVVSRPGGANPILHAIAAEHLVINPDNVATNLTAAQIDKLPVIEDKAWPATAPLIPNLH